MAEIKNLSIAEFIEVVKNRPVENLGNHSNPPVISIITSFFNAHHYFEETYRSIMNQTMQNFEWIIVDDCSTDEASVALFNSLESRSDKIKTFRHTENKGLGAGRNTAISKAAGKYLFIMDCDDLIDPTYLEKCVLFLELHPEFSIVNSWAVGFQSSEYWWKHGFENSSQFMEQNWVTTMLVYRKSDFDKLGGFDESMQFYKIMYEDWERWLRALTNQQSGWTLPEFLHFYRRTDSGGLSTGHRNVENERRVVRMLHQKYSDYFKENPPSPIPWREPTTPYDVRNFRERLEIENVINSNKFTGKRILFLFPHLKVGGADKFNLDLLKLLDKRGYRLTIATTSKSENIWHEYFYEITPDIFHLPNYAHETSWLSIICYLIESRKIDTVFISNSYISYYMLPLLRERYKNVSFVDYVHAYDPDWKVDGYPRLSRQFNDFFDAQMLTSRHLAEYNEEKEPSAKDKFSVCTINIDPNEWKFNKDDRSEIRELFNIPEETALLIFPARLEAQKRPQFFVKIIKELVECKLPVKAIILGNGSLLEETENIINELGLNDFISIIPPVGPELMKKYYCAADVLLLPTEYEGISLSLFEAMSMQLPLVASDVGGQRELVINGTGYLVKKGNGDDLEIEEYFRTLLPIISSIELRKDIGKAARKRILDFFTLEKMGDMVEEILNKATKSRKTHTQNCISQLAAEELLTVALECSRMEKGLVYLHTTLKQLNSDHTNSLDYMTIKSERDLLLHQKENMEASKFWKIRQKWFKFKYKMGLSKYES